MKSIVNAAPGVVEYGTNDLSTAPYTRAPEEVPQHLPKWLIYARTGPTTEQLLVGNERLLMYGEETFAEDSKYFNHQTAFSNAVNAQGNAAMYVRLLPTDHGPKSNVLVWLDVLETTVDDYERNADGSIKTDIAGDPIIVGQIPGYRVKFVTTSHATPAAAEAFGTADITVGDQSDPDTLAQSQRYPIFEFEASFFGEAGNLDGIRIWPLNTENVATLPTKLIAREKVYPYMFSLIRKNEKTGSAAVLESIMGEKQLMVALKPGAKDPLTNSKLYFGDRVVKDFTNVTDPRYAPAYGPFGRVAVYQDNIDTLVRLFQQAEADFLTEDSDFTDAEEDAHLFNFITGTDTTNAPYHSYVFVDAANAVRFSASTNVYAQNGSDGTLSHQDHANLASEYMQRYASPSDELNDVAYHVESHFYDTGFPLENKYDLINFIANRHDTFIHLSPSEFGQRALTLAEEYSVATALRSRLMLHPDSEYFGTSVFRGMIQGGTGRVRGVTFEDRLPCSYEIAVKSAKYMGAGNGVWKNGEGLGGAPHSILTEMYDLSITWVPDDIRNRNWDVGLNWVSRFDRTQFYFPAMKTVYDNDTSVLTSYLSACVIIQLHKILHKAHRQFSGLEGLTPAQFSQRVNDFIAEQVKGKFDNKAIIEPKCFFTALDQVRNYSWTVPVDVWLSGMPTVQTAYINVRRLADYAGA